MGTPEYRALSVQDVSIRAVAYNMERDKFDGDDVLYVYKKMQTYIEKARSGEGPSLIEISTYRFRGHSMSDPAKYRSPEEVEIWKRRDPLIRARKMLEFNGVEEKEFARIESEVRGIVEDALKFAEESPEPPPSELYTDVYAE
jgi:pyruvate dehydrogenase E1 component alpha subunit